MTGLQVLVCENKNRIRGDIHIRHPECHSYQKIVDMNPTVRKRRDKEVR